MFSWDTNTSAPIWYEGKRFPSYESGIAVSLELIEQNGAPEGRLIDLSNKEVRWYINDEFIEKGNGMQTLIAKGEKTYPGKDISVKVTVVDYYDSQTGQTYNVSYHKTIPILYPAVKVDYRLFEPRVVPGQKLVFSAFPFYFNVSKDQLRSSWKVANQEVSPLTLEDPFELNVDIPGDIERGRVFPIELKVSQVGKLFSSASFFEKFFID